MQKMSQPILSICIPTYNRPKSFERMLKILVPQLDCRVELVVRDDSDNNLSDELFKNIVSERIFSTQYFKGEKIGLDAANLFLLEKARGKFVWWFSDDDILLEGGVDAVINIIEKEDDLNFIWANFAFEKIENLAVDRPEGKFHDRNDVIETLGTNIGLLSTYVVRTDVAKQGIPYAKEHVHGFAFASTATVLWTIIQPGNSYFLRGPYIMCNPTTIEEFKEIAVKEDGSIQNNAFLTYGVYFYETVVGLSKNFKSRSIRKLLTTNFSALWRGMLVGWVGGWDTPDGKRLKMLQLYWSFPECWVALPLFCLPHYVVTLLYKIYKIFFSHRKFIFINKLRVLWRV